MEQSPPGPAPEPKPNPSQQPRPLLMSRTIVLIAISMLIIGAWFAIDRARTRSVISYGFFLAQLAAPLMIEQGWGRIIWTASQSGLVGIPGQPVGSVFSGGWLCPASPSASPTSCS